ncbi:TPA: hypothetical protein N0F65_010414 [Lagenidium giganteum]|uniref:PLAC8 family protein n=1 Tax=Lagenidium giganteum TaxID=4803 RepID=A0AAV2YQI2_9STRA|nr:TPA: hypothetical protein N0F65_010414 [Lagenidium giganteum]
MVPNCCMVTFVPCVSMAQISSRMGLATYSKALLFYGALWVISGGAVTMVFVLAIWHVRGKIRQRFNIPGSCLGDCCATCWCSCCVIAQMATHVKSYKPGTCDFGPVDTLPAFQ